MEEKEKIWLMGRSGIVTSSASTPLFTKGKKFGTVKTKDVRYNYWSEGAITYLLEKRMEIQEGRPKKNAQLPAFDWGNSQEVYGMEWLRVNEGFKVFHADQDGEEKVFKVCECGLGDSIDGFIMNESDDIIALVEQKTPVPWSTNWKVIFSRETTDDQLKIIGLDEYGDQLACHFIAYPDIDEMHLLFYKGMDLDDEFDTLDVLDPSRGRLILYNRNDFGMSLEFREERIREADTYLKGAYRIQDINNHFSQIYQ